MDYIFLALGALLLYFGGEALVGGSSSLARLWGVRPIVVGLTVVALGTSSPELFASLIATLSGTTDIALGNVIGSNIANIGLILGVTALITPIATKARFIRREVPFMLGVAVVLLGLVLWGEITRLAGALLVAGIGLYLLVLLRGDESPEVEAEFDQEYGESADPSPLKSWLKVAAGLVLLAGGAQLLITGATGIARALGVPELTIGLSLVAIGTSLPELFASMIAAIRREPDIALGNVVGSNVLNVLLVLGGSALAAPLPVVDGTDTLINALIMLGLSVLLLPFLLTGLRLGRREAAVLLLAYAGYIVYLYIG